VAEVRAVFDRYELHAAEIGRVIDAPVIRCRASGELVCEVPGRALADDAPRYAISGAPAQAVVADLDRLAAEPPSAETLLGLLASPNVRDRKPIWRRYDHMNGTNTVVGPGRGDAAVLRVKGTGRALALSIDGPGPARVGSLDPYLAGVSAVLEGALNVACHGAIPIGITDCLNFGSPETDLGAWQLERAIDGIADACRSLAVPVVSGNVSLYNETPDGPILPTPVVGTVGVLEDRRATLHLAWAPGDEVWLLGEPATDAGALAASEHAWRRGLRGGLATLDLEAAVRVIRLLPALAAAGTVRAAHDCSVGGLAVALARMAISAELGAHVRLDAADRAATAAAFGERGGRVLVGVAPQRVSDLRHAARDAGVVAVPLGTAGGDELDVQFGSARIVLPVSRLAEAWRTAF
jgi:phosphoribosylformylglycinamidine synthase